MALICIFETYLVWHNLLSWQAGMWGFVMHLLHHLLISDLPKVDLRSPTLWSIFGQYLIYIALQTFSCCI